MTDNEIIKALKICISGDCDLCSCKCESVGDCRDALNKKSLDLINRLMDKNKAYKHYYDECLKDLKKANAEIERLEDLNKCYYTSCQQIAKSNHEIKAEAVKEFAERLKEKLHLNGAVMGSNCAIVNDVDIDNLVKEMVGEG